LDYTTTVMRKRLRLSLGTAVPQGGVCRPKKRVEKGRRGRLRANKVVLAARLVLVMLAALLALTSVSATAKTALPDMQIFGARSLERYRAAGTSNVPWTLLAAIDRTELGTIANTTTARINATKSALGTGSQFDMVNRYAKGSVSFMQAFSKNLDAMNAVARLMDSTHRFPLPSYVRYTYEDGFGDDRSFGGERSHEGIDIIAPKGTPVYAAASGTVTKLGWLELGGWRIGVEDENGIYYYYAHLSAYGKYKVGDCVKAGDVLGYVGSTGYGPEGTSDQMVAHLHFGMYQNDRAFNAYSFLKAWEAGRTSYTYY